MENLNQETLFREDGYINATQLCQAGGKRFHNWFRTDETKAIIKALENETGIPNSQLFDIKKGGSDKKKQGSWIHPYLPVQLAQWISPIFSVKVSKWVLEWSNINDVNKEELKTSFEDIDHSHNKNNKEREVVERLLETLDNPDTEVETIYGYIDILTDTEIIEVKVAKNWKHSIGQILVYSKAYPTHNKRIHLFDMSDTLDIDSIKDVCDSFDIILTYECNVG